MQNDNNHPPNTPHPQSHSSQMQEKRSRAFYLTRVVGLPGDKERGESVL